MAGTRPRSGLQKEVIALYRRGMRNVMKKPADAQPNFLLHLRHSFRVPELSVRDHTAIEYQIRKFTRTLETLESENVRRMGVSKEMIDWWDKQVEQTLHRGSAR
ncbi:hypothetical protein NliqN6_4825 [Naganishia liquefaciens]|uniref:Succinate dehydrogenase assembly factor 1, mitochondrial n=1 Tax=Naganishia liquefaciens TaxID=104408 RepID=A0A8H3TWK8_9TREE|nr:hypothetical protein NliqN6_4825 [Naganishia liquefaciens]